MSFTLWFCMDEIWFGQVVYTANFIRAVPKIFGYVIRALIGKDDICSVKTKNPGQHTPPVVLSY